MSRQCVFEVEDAAAHTDIDAQTESERRVKQVVVVSLLLVNPSVEEDVHVGVAVEKVTQLGRVEQVGAGVQLVLGEAPDFSLPADFEAVIRFLKANPGKVDGMISRIVTFDTAQDALEAWNAAPGKVFRILLKIDE